jgi:DNA-binding MarR family transcriptional regulator
MNIEMELQIETAERQGRIGERDIGVIAWMRLARVYHLIDRATVELVKRFDLTTAQFDVIAQVGAKEGRTQQELADALLVTKGNITQLLVRLEERRLIERRTEPGRRGKLLFLTEPGWTLNRQVVPAQEAMIAGLFDRLTGGDQTELNRILRQFNRSLGQPGTEE